MSMVFNCTSGERSPQAKLTKNEVRHIVRCRRNGVTLGELSAIFGVSRSQICAIAAGRAWGEYTVNERAGK